MNSGILDGFTALFLAFLVTAVAMPFAIQVLTAFRAGQIISRDGPESHLAKQGTPTMGGIPLVAGLILASAVMGLIRDVHGIWSEVCLRAPGMLTVLAIILGNGLLGFLDDYLIISRGKSLGLKARQKLLGQFILAIAFVAWLAYTGKEGIYPTIIRIPFIGPIELGGWYWPFAVLLIVAMSNAVNLTDGLDGLVGGLAPITAMGLAWAALLPLTGAIPMDPAMVIVCGAIAGASLAFLWFNAHPAKIFMGDTGSLALGAGFAAIAILTKQEFMLLFFGFIYVIEALSVITQVISFKTTGKRIFKMSPIHHHFELSGWPEEKIVVRFWIIGLLACGLGIVLSGKMMRLW
ncbi:MAG: phospho-N-acetylmuramoyl-pentapeptide-transferase [Armatimonadota bacterium]|nr:phospho-N-acetylmuramoyl-pentapeptide-transferase [Armatimonadota bacterium]